MVLQELFPCTLLLWGLAQLGIATWDKRTLIVAVNQARGQPTGLIPITKDELGERIPPI